MPPRTSAAEEVTAALAKAGDHSAKVQELEAELARSQAALAALSMKSPLRVAVKAEVTRLSAAISEMKTKTSATTTAAQFREVSNKFAGADETVVAKERADEAAIPAELSEKLKALLNKTTNNTSLKTDLDHDAAKAGGSVQGTGAA